MIIIWITGTIWSGKWTVMNRLVKKLWFAHFSMREFIVKEIEKRWMIVDRDSMVEVGNDLRAKYWPWYIAEKLYEEAKQSWKNSIIESIRTLWEAQLLKSKWGFYLLSVDADPEIRYERIVSRASETDNISYWEFLDNEHREMNSDDPNKQNISKCIQLSDYKILNNGTIQELDEQLENAIRELKISNW